MIPLKLNIKNFLCYGEDVPTLDFEKIDITNFIHIGLLQEVEIIFLKTFHFIEQKP